MPKRFVMITIDDEGDVSHTKFKDVTEVLEYFHSILYYTIDKDDLAGLVSRKWTSMPWGRTSIVDLTEKM